MAGKVIHISEVEAAAHLASLLDRVRAGEKVVIESGETPVAVLHAAAPFRRSIAECIALLSEDSPAEIDETFSDDVAAATASHGDPLDPPTWA